MKNKFFAFRAVCVMMIAAVCGIFTGCDQMEEFSVSFKSANAGYVVVNATVNAPTEVAYICREEALAVVKPEIINVTGTKTTFNKSGEQKLLADLKENTQYYLYVVARLSAKEFSEVFSFTFTT